MDGNPVTADSATGTRGVVTPPPAVVPVYERQLDRDPRWALSEGSRHFEGRSAVFDALYKITRRLKELGIPYAVVGGMALFRHGLRRFTEDVDILVTREGLKTIHERLERFPIALHTSSASAGPRTHAPRGNAVSDAPRPPERASPTRRRGASKTASPRGAWVRVGPCATRLQTAPEGLGYLPPHPRSKHLRDTELGVRIEFLTTGEYPGDGKPKPVVFPEPGPVSFEADGIRYIKLRNLIELKLASGMTNPGRLKDLADVLELIKILGLSGDFALQLDPFVREKFIELWGAARESERPNASESFGEGVGEDEPRASEA
jgi:hypothetical protein